jgi:hypothetical protein
MNVKCLKLEDCNFGTRWSDEVENRWIYDDFMTHEEWRKGWVSFDCALYNQGDDRVYLGITCFDAREIFKAYDRRSGQFVDLGYGRIADRFDAKLHRSIVKYPDGCLYAAPALLHCSDKYVDAPGGAIIKFDPTTGHLKKLGIVLPHVYIQALALDAQRDTLYCQCFAPEYLASFDLRTRQARNIGLLGSGYSGPAQSENIAIDDEGCLWCAWSLTRAWQSESGPDASRLCKFDPRQDRIHFFQTGLPCSEERRGFERPEAFFNFGDGWMYASGGNGSFYRIDPVSGHAEWLFTPTPDRRSRLSSLVQVGDGIAYGVTGRYGQCELIRVHYSTGEFEKLGPIVDADGAAMYQCHDIAAAADGTLYACENDNPNRSSYLWEIRP